jgi:hypothetical protein
MEQEIRHTLYAADVLMGNDESAMRFLAAMRQAQPGGDDQEDARSARRARRAARRDRG